MSSETCLLHLIPRGVFIEILREYALSELVEIRTLVIIRWLLRVNARRRQLDDPGDRVIANNIMFDTMATRVYKKITLFGKTFPEYSGVHMRYIPTPDIAHIINTYDRVGPPRPGLCYATILFKSAKVEVFFIYRDNDDLCHSASEKCGNYCRMLDMLHKNGIKKLNGRTLLGFDSFQGCIKKMKVTSGLNCSFSYK